MAKKRVMWVSERKADQSRLDFLATTVLDPLTDIYWH